jgi:hypothetical protein
MVTPPEDGNRVPQVGEKGARKERFVEGLLAPPKKRSRAGMVGEEKGVEGKEEECGEEVRGWV